MKEQKPFEFKPWMWVVLLVAILLVVFNFDPVGNGLVKIFGKGAYRWATNIVLIALIAYTFIKKR
ncbi:MAG: hypothetical protein ABIB98_03605 [bacterium]